MAKKGKKVTLIKPIPANHHLATTHSVFDLPTQVEKASKIKEKDVFEGLKKKKSKPKR